jgi:hypothetical protein
MRSTVPWSAHRGIVLRSHRLHPRFAFARPSSRQAVLLSAIKRARTVGTMRALPDKTRDIGYRAVSAYAEIGCNMLTRTQ